MLSPKMSALTGTTAQVMKIHSLLVSAQMGITVLAMKTQSLQFALMGIIAREMKIHNNPMSAQMDTIALEMKTLSHQMFVLMVTIVLEMRTRPLLKLMLLLLLQPQ